MIAFIEQAIKQRLADGLGRMVTGVYSYGGEFDGEGLAQVVNQFPAVWVLFAGIKDTERHDTRGTRYKATGQFTVLVGDRASGSEADSRLGGLHRHDVGTYRLMNACRLLLTNQRLGLDIGRLKPGAARSLFSRQMEQEAISVFALEFETDWMEDALPDGEWPRPIVDGEADTAAQAQVYADVAAYQGRTDPVYPELSGVNLELRQPPKTLNDAADMAAVVETVEKP